MSTPVRMISTNSSNVWPPSGSLVLSGVKLREIMCSGEFGAGYAPKIPAATQVGRGIDLGRALVQEIRVSTGCEFRSRASGMAAIAVCLCVDDVAAQSHQGSVL